MGGRYAHKRMWKQSHYLLARCGHTPVQLPMSFNVAPTQTAPVVVHADGERRLEMYRWGLVPHWAIDLGVGAA